MAPPIETMAAKSNWLTIEGWALIVLGALAIIFPFFTGLAFGVFLGWLLIMVGVLGIVSAIAGRAHAHLGWSVASAVVAIVAGLLLAFHPLAASVAITLIVAAYLLIDGVALVALGLDQKKRGVSRWHFVVGAGVVDILLGVLILVLAGAGSAILVGVIIGIDLIIAGVGLLAAHRSQIVAPVV
jgi:membrane protein HdeD